MVDCILLMAGSGSRTTLGYNKIEYKINNKPLYEYSLEKFLSINECGKIILVVKEEDFPKYESLKNEKISIALGGKNRFDSVLNGAKLCTSEKVLIHDAARPNTYLKDVINLIEASKKSKSCCLGVKVKDCIRNLENNESRTLDRNTLYQIQTPQIVDRKLLIEGLEKNSEIFYYDDCEVLEKNFGINTIIVEGSSKNIKVTTDEDLDYIKYLMNELPDVYKIGHSKDTHRFEKDRKLILGGVDIPFEMGLIGHSDADVVYHAVVESIIGALGLGDIGKLFPDTDMKYKDISSSYFMEEVYKIMDNSGFEISNLDIIIYIEKPMLKDYKVIMEENISKLLKCEIEKVNLKATRGEGIGFIGLMQGVSAEAVCLLKKK